MGTGYLPIERSRLREIQQIYVDACRQDPKFFSKFVREGHQFTLSKDKHFYPVSAMLGTEEGRTGWKRFTHFMSEHGYELKYNGRSLLFNALLKLNNEQDIGDCSDEDSPYFEKREDLVTADSVANLTDRASGVFSQAQEMWSTLVNWVTVFKPVSGADGVSVYRLPICHMRVREDGGEYTYIMSDNLEPIFAIRQFGSELDVITKMGELYGDYDEIRVSVSPIILCKSGDILNSLSRATFGEDDESAYVDIVSAFDSLTFSKAKRFLPMYGSEINWAAPVAFADSSINDLYGHLAGRAIPEEVGRLYMKGDRLVLSLLSAGVNAPAECAEFATRILLGIYSAPIKEAFFVFNSSECFHKVTYFENPDGEITLLIY